MVDLFVLCYIFSSYYSTEKYDIYIGGAMIKKKNMLFLLLIVLTIPTIIFASGFAIYEHGATANGLAGAFGGIANDASALYYNPAALSFLSSGKHLTVGTTLIFPTFSWQGGGGLNPGDFPTSTQVDMNSKVFFPSNLYYVKKGDGKSTYGVGFFNPFGISKKWSDSMTINASYIHLFFEERTITNSDLDAPFNGTYNGSAELIGFGINYNF